MRLGMLIDLARCIGCNACAVACKMENETPTGKFNTWIESWDVKDENGYIRRANVPKQCNHCDNPVCVEVCPTEASYIAEDGTVQVDFEKCIGCQACIAACPYQVRWLDEESNTVHKCTFCHHRTTNGMLPACVMMCVAGARMFGDLDDPESDISKRMAEVETEVLMPETEMGPAIYYIGLDKTLGMERVSAVHQGGNVKTPFGADAAATDEAAAEPAEEAAAETTDEAVEEPAEETAEETTEA